MNYQKLRNEIIKEHKEHKENEEKFALEEKIYKALEEKERLLKQITELEKKVKELEKQIETGEFPKEEEKWVWATTSTSNRNYKIIWDYLDDYDGTTSTN